MEVLAEVDSTASEMVIHYHQPPEGGIGDTFEISVPSNRSYKGASFERLVYKDLFGKEVLHA
jgi:hypothetical protein